jgi:hypothetical protein
MGFFFYTGMEFECIRKLHCGSSEKHPPHSIVCKHPIPKIRTGYAQYINTGVVSKPILENETISFLVDIY